VRAGSHDLIVVGAGPAGAAAGITAARAGLKVALIDKARFPREKLCGGGITGRCRKHLIEILGDAGIMADTRALTHMRLVAGREVLADLPNSPPIWMVMRRAFDERLLALALSAGCDDLTGQRLAGIDSEGSAVTLADGTTLSAPVIIGADGAKSAVATAIFGRAFDPDRVGLGLEIELPRATDATDAATVEVDLAAAGWGYGWTFPKVETITIGVGGVHARNSDLRASLAAYLDRKGLDPTLTRCKGAFLPFGEVRPVPGKGRVLLAGDAAGLVDPITGEGIAWALKSGQLAGRAVIETRSGGSPHEALRPYTRALRPIQAELKRARLLRWLIYQKRLQPAFLRLLSREPSLQRRYLALLSGDLDYADLGWRAAPRLAAKVLARLVA
jgi:geranylgeranyl reductase family protein